MRLQERIVQACKDLNLDVVSPFTLEIGGRTIHAKALISQLGFGKGMIVITDFSEIEEVVDLLTEYGFSCMSDYEPGDDYDNSTWIDVFSDWGWNMETQKEPRPDWMLSTEEIEKKNAEELEKGISQTN